MTLQIILFISAILLFTVLIIAYRKTKKAVRGNAVDESSTKQILSQNVPFYEKLKPSDEAEFLKRVVFFLSKIKITAVQNVKITDEDKVLIAAAGVIPLFRFKNWFYNNLDEILVYPGSFNRDFEIEGNAERDIIGMVGDGAMHRTMIISLPDLRAGFRSQSPNNTAIHEFAHLLDKSDGSTDGVPELILGHDNVKPWVQLMHRNIAYIRSHHSDINPYGATNEAEFFAVMSEYFFQQPEKLKGRHPDLYKILEEAFDNKHG